MSESLLSLSDQVLGLEVGESTVRAVLLGIERDLPVLKWAREITIPEPGETNPLYRACQEIVANAGDALIVSTTETTDVLVRQIRIELAKDKEIDSALEFQIEPLLPFPVEEAVMDRAILERDKQGVRVAVLTLPKDRLKAHLDRLLAGGVEPERTSCPPAALATLLYRLIPSNEAQGILHLGEDATTCVVVRQGKVIASRAIACGVRHLLAESEEIDFERSDPAEIPHLHQRAENMRSEVARAFFALAKGAASIPQIFLSGEFGRLCNFENYLAQAMEYPLTPLPERSPFCAPLGHSAKFAVPLGLALGALPLSTPRIDFRKKEFAYPRPWRRFQKRLVTYFVLCIALAGGLLVLGKALRSQKMTVLKNEYEALAQWSDLGTTPNSDSQTPSVIASQAEMIGRRFQSLPETYPLAPAVPRVSDVLAWLASHPKLVVEDTETGEERSLIQLQNFHYAMVKRPTQKQPKEHYRVRVDVEFTAENPTVARELHAALLEPNPFIDDQSEVKWSQNRGLYRTSFYLKDETYYPA